MAMLALIVIDDDGGSTVIAKRDSIGIIIALGRIHNSHPRYLGVARKERQA